MCEIIYLKEDTVVDDVVVALGNFDGVHLGHQELLKRTKKLATEHGYKSAMMTFEIDPDFYLNVKDVEYLTSLEEKQRILTSMGIDYMFVLDFADVGELSHEEFYCLYLSQFHGIVCGADYKFGYKAQGNVMFLKERFDICEVVDLILFYNHKIGTTEIKEFLSRGNLKLVNELLGRRYSVDVCVYEIGEDAICAIYCECYVPRDGKYKCEYFINEYESRECFSIIEKMELKLVGVNNVNIHDIIRVELIEYIESSGV